MQSVPLVDYYSRRAAEYERIYEKPERQEALAELGVRLRGLLADQRVLELACGTGYWTAIIAHSAQSVMAIE
ncbi:MAG: hypothetical protein JWL90_3409 [Chthoniobacteraceae bacterium]|nr:hypothetical protein [Chthoniobacteraceae bacterium]